jgi:outer membrane protease
MITIKNIVVLVILSASLSTFAETVNKDYAFSVSPLAGLLYGQVDEIVYKFPSDDLYYSELIWDIKPIVYAGFGVDFVPISLFRKGSFTSSLSFKFGLPLKTGIMEDRDWSNLSFDYVTHYSCHEAFLRNAVLAELMAGYSLNFGLLDFSFYGEFSYTHLSWLAKNGFIQYPPFDQSGNYPQWQDAYSKESISGDVIKYTQNWFIFSPGFSLNWRAASFFSLKGLFSYSPLIYCADRDDHLLRGITFKDYLLFGHYLKGGGELIFSRSGTKSLSLFFLYKHISGSRGYTLVKNYRENDAAGAGYSALELGAAIKIRVY